jgi:putative transposase
VRHQCELLDVNRSNLYYPCHPKLEATDLDVMNVIRDIWLEDPSYGYRKITAILRDMEYTDNRKRVLRLMNEMGIQSIHPNPITTISNKQHKKYPYLLKDIEITRPNQVFATDITYLKINSGFLYLIAVLDLYSRYVVAWNLSDNMEVDFCLVALKEALSVAIPDIFNTDQGSQFTSEIWTDTLKSYNVKISMDGKGSFYDNIFVERLWRTVKYEDFYLHAYESMMDVYNGLDQFFWKYNNRRPHQALQYKTPGKVYCAV